MSRNSFYTKNISYKNRLSFNLRFVTEHFLGKTFFKRGIAKWEAKNRANINKQILAVGKKSPMEIDTYEGYIKPEVFRKKYINKGVPVLIRGGAKNWKAIKEWDFSFFKDNYGDHPVVLTKTKELGDDFDEDVEVTNLREIIDGLKSESKKYARFNPLLNKYPELTKSFDQEWLENAIKKNVKRHHLLFIGNKGTKTNIHNAADDNIFVQVRGRKKWLIWDHQAIYGIAPTVNRDPAKDTETSPYKGDKLNPGLPYIPRYEVELEEGDMLYIPSYSWHYVENPTPSIGLSIRWLQAKNTLKNLPLLAFLEVFNTNPNIFKIMKDLNKPESDFNEILEIIKKSQQ